VRKSGLAQGSFFNHEEDEFSRIGERLRQRILSSVLFVFIREIHAYFPSNRAAPAVHLNPDSAME
jgi:hypothetical protein